ncbi:MAG: PD40 domain-containing protein [Flavobacteriales bacterium]|nr:PD40 domain-containing protein [Flavobacteriales bacterium]
MIKTLSFSLLLASMWLPCGAFGQGEGTSFNWKFEEANKLMEEKFFNQAADIWKPLVEAQPNNANLNYKLGLSYFNSYNQKGKAFPYLKRASDLRTAKYGSGLSAGYDPFEPKETNSPIEVEYYVARCYHIMANLDSADMYYSRYMALTVPENDLYKQAVRGKEQVANARVLMATPHNWAVSNLGNKVNSEYPDFSPVLSVDGNALFYTSRRIRPDSSNLDVFDPLAGLPYENIYVSYKDRNGVWQPAELLNVNPPGAGHMAIVNVAADGQTLLIYRDDNGNGNVYISKLVGELWSDPVLIGSDVNTRSWEPHAAITADENTLYFISDRKGGLGGRDIYRVVKLPNGEWSKAVNLGAAVNTPYDEDGVFIHPNGRLLYFSSKGHNSMGGFDIFTTELQDDGTWSKPENLGHPVNTVDDDVFFVTTADGRRGYFSSEKLEGFGEKDIYFVDLPEDMEAEGLAVLKGFIIPPPGQPLPPSTILYVTNKKTGEVKAYKPRQRDGVYVVILAPCNEYNLDYRVDDKTIHTEDIFVECETAYQEINKEIYLNPVSIMGPASIVDLPKGSPPGSKEKGLPVGKPLTDAELKEKGKKHVMPDASYAGEYAKYYAYNQKDIDQADAEWTAFVDKVVALLEKNGKANVVIEASASHVPTKTFGSNENLSTARMEDARKRLIEAVQARGKDPANIFLEAVNHLVQGPKYNGDWKDTEKYGRFQYAKLKVR